MDVGIAVVKKEYEKTYGEVGIAEMVWDEEMKRYRYVDTDQKWQWVEVLRPQAAE